ncbi:MAG: class I SAM-dependent methyltransferase [Dehalococcoidia bacterium]
MQQPDRRSSFDDVPAIYDRARPEYPPALFDDLFAYLNERAARPQPAIIEVGPGTGQATHALLERGALVTAVELGPNMAEYLAAKYAGRSGLRVLTGAFEDAPLEPGRWDAVFAATAYHWVDRAERMRRPHALLVPGGVLAVVDTNQVRSEADRGFFERSHPIYLKYRPGEPMGQGLPLDLVPPIFDEMCESGLFEDVRLWRYRWDQRYDADEYADLVMSYSDAQNMEPGPRAGLIADLRAMVAAEPGGCVVRPLVITLAAGRRTGP